MDCFWNLLDTEDVLRDACSGRESGDSFCSFWKGELVLECGIDQGSFTLVMNGLLIAHLPSTFLLSESKRNDLSVDVQYNSGAGKWGSALKV